MSKKNINVDLIHLLSCPFCGKEAMLKRINEYYDEFAVQCKGCDAKGPWQNDKLSAIIAWNKRKIKE